MPDNNKGIVNRVDSLANIVNNAILVHVYVIYFIENGVKNVK